MTPKAIAEQLGETGLCVCPNFLNLRQWTSSREDLDGIFEQGGFKPAGTGRDKLRKTTERIRSDQIHWLNRTPAIVKQNLLWRKIDGLMLAFNRGLFLGLKDFEGHYSVYPKGGYYQRHVDRFRDESRRTVSFVLYLNRGWRARDGGRLRIYTSEGHQDVDPKGGTMVCFLSAESEHEVLLNHRNRFSVAGWFRT